VLVPADVFQQAEVFGELQAQRLGLDKVLGPLQGDPEGLDAAEVVAGQFVEPVALVVVMAGTAPPPLDRGTEDEPATRSSAAYVGTVSLASKALSSVPGPGALVAPPGPLIRVSRRERRWTGGPSQGLESTSVETHLAPELAPRPFLTLIGCP
jgi:hypothetical protein